MTKDAVTPAIDRLFRAYDEYLDESGPDTLVNLLTALHSLDEKIKGDGEYQLFHIPEYLVLKALRNHIVHTGEVPHVVTAKAPFGVPFITDLLFACLVSLEDCNAALVGIDNRERRAKAEEAFKQTTLVYKDKLVDLNPSIFNCVVKVYEKLCALELGGSGASYSKFVNQYVWETENGYSHYVSGGVGLHAADMASHQDWVIEQYEKKFA